MDDSHLFDECAFATFSCTYKTNMYYQDTLFRENAVFIMLFLSFLDCIILLYDSHWLPQGGLK